MMCDFNILSDEEKKLHHEKLLHCAKNFGGKNFFLQLLEAIRQTKPHPLVAANSEFSIELVPLNGTRSYLTTRYNFLLKHVKMKVSKVTFFLKQMRKIIKRYSMLYVHSNPLYIMLHQPTKKMVQAFSFKLLIV